MLEDSVYPTLELATEGLLYEEISTTAATSSRIFSAGGAFAGAAGATPGPNRGRPGISRGNIGRHIVNFSLTNGHFRAAAAAMATSDASIEEKLAAALGLLNDEE